MRLLILASALLVLPLMAAMVLLLPVDEKVNAGGVVRAREDIHVFAPQEGVIKTVRCCVVAQVRAAL